MNRDFIQLIRDIRGSAAPGQPMTDGIWYELTQADKNGNTGIYGDILAKYGVVTESAGTFDQAVAILENLNVNVTTLAPGEQATSALVNGVWQIGIPAGVDGADGVSGFTPALTMAYESGQLKYRVTVNGVEVTNSNILDLQGLVDARVTANADIQATQDAKQEVLDAVADAEALAGSIATAVTAGTNSLESYTTVKKAELDTKKSELENSLDQYAVTKVQAYDANALDRVQEYDANASDKVDAYNVNNTTKLNEYNANHVDRLGDINIAYAGRIVDMLNTKRLLGMVDQFVVQTSTQTATFISTDDVNYLYYVNGTRLELGVDYTVRNSTTIDLVTGVHPGDVVIQLNSKLLGELLVLEHILTQENIGVANGIAGLDANGLVPSTQLPSYVDDVIEVATKATLPVIGEAGKIYVVAADESSNGDTSSYRWTGTVYAMVSNTLNAADVKSLYESNADTNAYTDAEKTKLASIEPGSKAVNDATPSANPYSGSMTQGLHDNQQTDIRNIVKSILALKSTSAQGEFGINGIQLNLSTTEQVMPFNAITQSTNTDVFQIATNTGTVKEPGIYSFISTVEVEDTGADGSVGTLTFNLRDTTTNEIYYTQSATVEISNNDRETIPFNSLMVIPDTMTLPVTIDINVVSNISGYRIVGFKSILSANTSSASITTEHNELVNRDATGSHPASAITNTPSGSLEATTVQDALNEIQGDMDAVHMLRADKYLAAQAVVNMMYSNGKLIKVQYNNATDVEYEVLAYDGTGKLTSVQHYTASTLRGTTTLSYTDGKLVSAIYAGV